jgi:hypothetical protein
MDNQKEAFMKSTAWWAVSVPVCLALADTARAEKSDAELIAAAETAGPLAITQSATIKTHEGRTLRKGSNSWTCYSPSATIGPLCNEAQWDQWLAALGRKKPFQAKELSVSYMLAGDKGTPGASNTNPFATKALHEHDWVIEGPHVMILVPDPALLDGLSTNPKDAVYVMWKGTPYAHIMVKVAEEE